MSTRLIQVEPLTREAFAPFGDVIEADGTQHFPINRGTVERFHDLAAVDVGDDGRPLISIVECRQASRFPVPVPLVERHPLGSQAFIPMGEALMCVVVAAPGESVAPGDLRAFLSNGRQGVNYHPGTWHMPLVAFATGQRFLVVDRGGSGENCDEHEFAGADIRVDADSPPAPGQEV